MLVDTPRLPGVSFEAQPPAPDQVLPRMDVAVFVGFASRGPLDTPVAIEDLTRFTEIFGDDVSLAWDPKRGINLHGHLRAAVAAFLRNGGRRCWVIRVARRDAPRATFAMPGVVRCDPSRGRGREGRLVPAGLAASSVGAWADRTVVGASVDVRGLPVLGRVDPPTAPTTGDDDDRPPLELRLELADDDDLAPGDVVRLQLVDDRVAFLLISSVVRMPPAQRVAVQARPLKRPVAVQAEHAVWFRRRRLAVGATGRAAYSDANGRARTGQARVAESTRDGHVAFDIVTRNGAWPQPGSWVWLSVARQRWWLAVETAATILDGSVERVRVTGQAMVRTHPAPGALTRSFGAIGRPGSRTSGSAVVGAELHRLRVWTGTDGRLDSNRGDLGLGPAHPRFVGALPRDEERFGHEPLETTSAPDQLSDDPERRPFAVAGLPLRGYYLPLALGVVPRWLVGPVVDGRSALERDGLDEVGPGLFLDRALEETSATRLIGEADFLRYESDEPRRLTGIHAALGVEEATIIAVPDAGQPIWDRWRPEPPPDAVPAEVARRTPETFERCDPGPPAVPIPWLRHDPRSTRSFDVVWAAVEFATSYIVEERREPESWTPPKITDRRLPRHRVSGIVPGTYRYRVRAVGPGGSSDWSQTVRVAVDASGGFRVVDAADRSLALKVHVALLRLCAARGDMFALLSLPAAAGPDDATAHVEDVRARITGVARSNRADLPRPELDPFGVLSYGALYHPWLVTLADRSATATLVAAPPTRTGSALLPASDPAAPARNKRAGADAPSASRPPDGAIAGVFAARAIARGAWTAPANTPLEDVVALDRRVRDDGLARMHLGGVNVVRQAPAGFLVLAAETLSEDRTLRPLNVRRLLSLLRRLAMLHGPDYVFEPNGDAFRRRIQRGFEALLAVLYERGAFAGARASDGFRVAVGDPPNSRQSIDAGRLIVELKVAPSVPLEFLTVRLLRTGDRLAVEGP